MSGREWRDGSASDHNDISDNYHSIKREIGETVSTIGGTVHMLDDERDRGWWACAWYHGRTFDQRDVPTMEEAMAIVERWLDECEAETKIAEDGGTA